MTTQPEALRLAENLTAPRALRTATAVDAAAELLRLHAENEMLWKEREEPHQKIELYLRECNRLEDERDELRKVNAELLEALRWIERRCPAQLLLKDLHRIHMEAAHDAGACARAAIAKAEGEKA
jgi:hypothetical protein